MAEIEQTPQAGEEKKEKGTLENVIDEILDFGKKAIVIGAVAAMPFAYNFYDPSHVARAAVTASAFAASKVTTNIVQNKDPLEGFIRNGFNGTLLSYPIAEGFKGLNSLEAAIQPNYGTVAAKTIKGAGMAFGLQPGITAGNVALNYGLGKKLRENLWPTLKKSFKLIAIPGIINVNWLYQFGLLTQMIVSGSLSYLLNLSSSSGGENKGSIKNLASALNPFSYIGAAASVSYNLAKNTIGGFYTGLYDVGKSINSALGSYQSSAPAQSSPARPAPSTVPAPQPAH